MAVASYSIKPSNSKYTNWLEACLAVLITKEGIEPFVYDEIKQFQQQCLSDICNNNGLPSGSVCSGCCTENVVVCPTNRICNVGRGRCSYHNNVTKQYLPTGCPNQICHNLRNEIQNAHRFYGPSYKNTDATHWCTNPWEIAKCFMPPDGYKDVTSPSETDFNGIINVIINYKDFQAKISDDLSKKTNVFEKGRNIGKAVRHSPTLEVEDADLQRYFTDLQNLLSDPKLHAGNTDVQNARKKMTQLQNDTLVIDLKNFRQMLEDVAKDVRQDIQEEKDALKKESDKRKLELIKAMKNSVETIEATGKTLLSEVSDALKSAISDIERKADYSIDNIQSETDVSLGRIKTDTDANIGKLAVETDIYVRQIDTQSRAAALKMKDESNVGVEKIVAECKTGTQLIQGGVEKGIKQMKTEADTSVKQITSLTEESIQRIEGTFTTCNDQSEDAKYNKLKKDLKEDLAEFHRDRHSTIPLSPLFEEIDTPLLNFYIMPGMKVIKIKNGKEDKSEIQSLSEVFMSGSKFSHEIYVSADGGFGKTAFSKYLTVLWRQAHFPDVSHSKYLSEESVNVIRDFEILFLVLLRESSHICSIDDLVFNQVEQNLSRSTSYNRQFLQEILNRERCLVVLDGLDEWTHPQKCEQIPQSIPHRNSRKHCTVLTTTRPWKLSITKLNTCQIDKKIELSNLDSDSALELTARALKKLKGQTEDENKLDEVDEMRTEAEQLLKRYYDFEQVYVPLLLMYIICLWCDAIPLGQSKCGLYISIIELLLSRTISKYKKFPRAEVAKRICDLQCFREFEHCIAYFTFLTSLGELAFQTLFSEREENRLVFDSSIAEKCLKEEFLELGRLTGIITQDKQRKLLSQILKTSFSHKTVQEFFAALYISTCPDQDIVLTKVLSFCDSLQGILYFSNVFIFISGMNAKLFCLLPNEIVKVINKDERTSKYRSTIEYGGDHPLKNIQDMLVSCFTEVSDNTVFKMCLHDFFFTEKCEQENYYASLQRLARQNKTNIRSIHLDVPESLSLSKMTDECELNDPEIHCQNISVWCECKEDEIIRLISSSVKCLHICALKREDEYKDAQSSLTDELCKTFQNSSLLETIYIELSTVSHEFLNYIITVKSIKQITLYVLYCSEHGDLCPGFNFDLSQHPELRELVLTHSNVTLCDMNKDTSSLKHNLRNIENISLAKVKMSSLSLRCLVEIIEKMEHKVKVQLMYCEIIPKEQYIDIKNDIIHRTECFVVKQDQQNGDWDVFEFVTNK